MYKHSSGNNPLIAREKRRLRRQHENTLFAGLLVVCLLCVLGLGAWWYLTRPNPAALLASLQSNLAPASTPLPAEQISTPAATELTEPTLQVEPTAVSAAAETPVPTASGPDLWQRIAGLFHSEPSSAAPSAIAETPQPTATYDATGLEPRELTAIIQAAMTDVNGFLPNPNEASYPNMMEELDQWLIARANDVVTVQSYVDTEDEQGAKTRITFRLQMSYKTGDLTYLELNNSPIYGSAVPIH
jgi:hypothetical protein